MQIKVSKFLNSGILHLDLMDLLWGETHGLPKFCVYIHSCRETVHILFQILRGLSPKQVLNYCFMFYWPVCAKCYLGARPFWGWCQEWRENHTGNKGVYILLWCSILLWWYGFLPNPCYPKLLSNWNWRTLWQEWRDIHSGMNDY